MTIAEYIEKVKSKLDEFSPFEEPTSFIAADGDADYAKVKPLVAYIENELPNAVRYCLSILPQSLLTKDIEKTETLFSLKGRVGVIYSEDLTLSTQRFVRVQVPNYWRRDVTAFIKSEDVEYLLQQNEHTRGGVSKPVVVYVAERDILELYSFPNKLEGEGIDTDEWDAIIWSVDTHKTADMVKSSIEDFIVIKCAQLVADILGNTNASTAMDNEFQRKVTAL
jgi:hypothetical protein